MGREMLLTEHPMRVDGSDDGTHSDIARPVKCGEWLVRAGETPAQQGELR